MGVAGLSEMLVLKPTKSCGVTSRKTVAVVGGTIYEYG
jgi:hypothetical protein